MEEKSMWRELQAVDPITRVYIVQQVGGEPECSSEDQSTN